MKTIGKGIEIIDAETNGAGTLAANLSDQPDHFLQLAEKYLDVLSEPFDPKEFIQFLREHGSPKDARIALSAMMSSCPGLIANYLH